MHLRLGPRPGQRRLTRGIAAVIGICTLFTLSWVTLSRRQDRGRADARQDEQRPVNVDLEFQPTEPRLGQSAMAVVRLEDADGRLLRAATIELQAQMTHPGMAPVIAAFTENQDGTYSAPVTFTMAGGWVLIASGALPDGREVTQTRSVTVGTPP